MNTSNQLLDALTREGVLINASVRYWRGCKKLQAEDLGLNPTLLSDRLISLGHKRLLPKEALAALALVESRAHALIEANTFSFLNGLAHFAPNSLLDELSGKLKELEEQFWKAKSEFLSRYSLLREKAIAEWRQMAQKLNTSPERLLTSIEAAFPHAKAMDKLFAFEVNLFQIAVPERLGIDLITAEDQKQVMAARSQAAQEAGEKIRHQTEQFVSDCIAALREQTAQLCSEMLESIRTNETGVHQKTLNRLIRFIDQFKQMNFANDSEMESQLEQVRRELLSRTAEEYRDDTESKSRLIKGLGQLADHARVLAQSDNSFLVQRFGEMGKRRFHLAA